MQVIRTKKGTFYREKIYVDGKAIHSARFLRKSDASQWKARMMNEKSKFQSTGVLPKVFSETVLPSFEEFSLSWLATRVKNQLAARSHEHYSNILKRHLNPRFGKLRLNQIHANHANQLIQDLIDAGHNANGVNLILGIFKRVMIEAEKEEHLEKNPLKFIRKIKSQARNDVYLSIDEINKILEVSKGHYFHSLFLIAVNTGMRRGEIAGLCWDKVNFNTSLMEISRIRDRNGLGDRTKTLKSRRFIPMNAVVKNHLQELKMSAQSELVVVNDQHSAFDVNHLFRDFRIYLKKAEINKHFRFHDLRHTFASHFMMNKGNIYDLQKILGHTSLEMTQRYAHLAPEHLVLASNVVSFGARDVNVKLKVAPI